MKIGIIDYKAGNVYSVALALKRLGHESVLTNQPDELEKCDKLIFPGVGHAKHAMDLLNSTLLPEYIRTTKKPLLGICLGMQLLCKHSAEGDVNCIGVFDVGVTKFESNRLKIPHTGWNTVFNLKGELFKGISENEYFYFVHSYYVPLTTFQNSTCNYEIDFSSSLEKDNFFAVQFHPEKSGVAGEKLLANFLKS